MKKREFFYLDMKRFRENKQDAATVLATISKEDLAKVRTVLPAGKAKNIPKSYVT